VTAASASMASHADDASIFYWRSIESGQSIPEDAVVTGSAYVGRSLSDGEPGEVYAKADRRMDYFRSHSNGLRRARKADVLCAAGEYSWHPIKRDDVIPTNSVRAGETRTDGVVYVGRSKLEAGKINTRNDGKMASFWCGSQWVPIAEANILVSGLESPHLFDEREATLQWMYADNLNPIAHLNQLRWSSKKTFDQTVEELIEKNHPWRPIRVREFWGNVQHKDYTVDSPHKFRQQHDLCLPQCSTTGCMRETWNGQTGEVCCKSCKESGAKDHESSCTRRSEWRAHPGTNQRAMALESAEQLKALRARTQSRSTSQPSSWWVKRASASAGQKQHKANIRPMDIRDDLPLARRNSTQPRGFCARFCCWWRFSRSSS